MNSPSTIVLLGSNPETRLRLERVVRTHLAGSELSVFESIDATLEFVTRNAVSGIVVDGTADALGSCRRLKASDVTQPIPLVLLSRDPLTVREEVTAIGVEDFARWSVADDELAARLRWMQLLHHARMTERQAVAHLREAESSHRKALGEVEGRYRRLVETWPDMMVICTDGIVTALNTAGKKLLGEALAEAIIGRPAESMVHQSSVEALR